MNKKAKKFDYVLAVIFVFLVIVLPIVLLAFFLGIWLKRLDTKNHYGLELPNVKK